MGPRPIRQDPVANARALHKLSRERVTQLLRDNLPGRYSDGGNLYLRLRPPKAPAWVFTYRPPGGGAQRDMSLGAARDVPIPTAREQARLAREKLHAGIDPLGARAHERAAAGAERAAAKRAHRAERATVAREARQFHEAISPKFRNRKHREQWIGSLELHVPHAVWHKPIDAVTPEDLLGFLPALFAKKHETARRVRARLDNVFADAVDRGACRSNPAALIINRLKKRAGKRPKSRKFRSLPWPKAPALFERLRALTSISARALEFTGLTGARTSEVIGSEQGGKPPMTWDEVDLERGRWVIPGERMKEEAPHTVFLGPRALAVLGEMRGLDARIVFPSLTKPGRSLSNMAMIEVLKHVGFYDVTTVHGLRSTLSSWGNETGHRKDVIEAALAHQEEERVRRIYNDALYLREREQLAAEWDRFCTSEPAAPISLTAARHAMKR